MFQGVASNVGKSLLTAALCRLLARRGFRVAPFKAQNMALNSFVTADGKEMGRAQVLQAQACGMAPDVRMNPVLLKPTSNVGSQVVVMGSPVGTMDVHRYLAFKSEAWKAVTRAYESLAGEVDVMVLEGAGSPAEINLRAHDIVNMRMARHADARVLLVADIDRGGAFAALAGTMSLLTPSQRRRVAGFVLNKFRGDPSLLASAMEFLQRRTGRPFLGVVPMLEGLQLPEEDSVSFRQGSVPGVRRGNEKVAPSDIDIVVLDLPRISNFTDLDPLVQEPGVCVRAVARVEDFGEPDAVIVPGSKNTLHDMAHLRREGFVRALSGHVARGGTVVGLCAGLQMLGDVVEDPLGLEEGGTMEGLGLLPLATELVRGKTLRRVAGRVEAALDSTTPEVAGYEIHHGVTRPTRKDGDGADPVPTIRDGDGKVVGWGRRDEGGGVRIWGTYLHGVFDADGFRHGFLQVLRKAKGLPSRKGAVYGTGPELDRLADAVAAHLDVEAIVAMTGL
jgi:adenosylcobyric acid synthase